MPPRPPLAAVARTPRRFLRLPTRRALRIVVSAIAWILAVAALVGSTCWMWSGASYAVDLLANLGAQLLLLTTALVPLLAAFRRGKQMLIALLACALHLIPLLQHRAAYLPVPINNARPRAPDEVRFFHYNDSSSSDKKAVYALMERSSADIIEILAPPVHMQFDVIYGRGLEDLYEGKMIRAWEPEADGINPRISSGFVVSRWPITPYDCEFLGPLSERFMAGVVERPEGPFAVVAVHPRSPRNPKRWIEGNAVCELLIDLVGKMQFEGLQVVVLTDLNSTPTGWRNRRICSITGLFRAKPVLEADGTYPDLVPLNIRTARRSTIPARWPASIAIDDALISPGIEVLGWSVGQRLNSEHRPVTIDLRIPGDSASATNPVGR